MHIVDVLMTSLWALFTWAVAAFAGATAVMMAEDRVWRKDQYVVTWFCLVTLAGLLSIFIACFA